MSLEWCVWVCGCVCIYIYIYHVKESDHKVSFGWQLVTKNLVKYQSNIIKCPTWLKIKYLALTRKSHCGWTCDSGCWFLWDFHFDYRMVRCVRGFDDSWKLLLRSPSRASQQAPLRFHVVEDLEPPSCLQDEQALTSRCNSNILTAS